MATAAADPCISVLDGLDFKNLQSLVQSRH